MMVYEFGRRNGWNVGSDETCISQEIPRIYRKKGKREELFNIVQKYVESLEDFVERLLYNVKRSGQTTIRRDVLNIIMLWGILEDCLVMINLLGKGDISKEPFDHIVDLC